MRRPASAPEVPGQQPIGYEQPPEALPPAVWSQDTSAQAALAVRHRAPTLRQRALVALTGRPMIDEELARVLGVKESTARARRVELRDSGQVIDSGDRALTNSGAKAIVWATVEASMRSGDPASTRTNLRPSSREPAASHVDEVDRVGSADRGSEVREVPTTLAELFRWRPSWISHKQFDPLVAGAMQRNTSEADAVREVVELLS